MSTWAAGTLWARCNREPHSWCVFIPQTTKSVTAPDELGALASQVTVDYSQLAVQGRLAAHTAEPEEVSRTRVALEELVSASILTT